MHISIKDFRCFHATRPIEIRPINILVGENSAGKSSFLAGIRFLLDLLRLNATASFNKDPFYLGSFEQIAHYRGGRFGRAKTFSFEMGGELSRTLSRRRHPDLFGNGADLSAPQQFSLEVSFQGFKTQPVLEKVSFKVGKFGVDAQFGDTPKLEITTPSRSSFLLDERFRRDRIERSSFDMTYLDFALRDLRFLTNREDRSRPDSDQFAEEVLLLSDYYRAFQRSLPREVYASAPVRSKPERTYNPADIAPTADGGHIPFVLAQMQTFEPKVWSEIESSLAEFGKASGLFNRLQVKQVSSSPGGPFQLIVNLAGRKSNIIDVGYGVSQALPIIADLLRYPEQSQIGICRTDQSGAV
jgi:hypothetical protein